MELHDLWRFCVSGRSVSFATAPVGFPTMSAVAWRQAPELSLGADKNHFGQERLDTCIHSIDISYPLASWCLPPLPLSPVLPVSGTNKGTPSSTAQLNCSTHSPELDRSAHSEKASPKPRLNSNQKVSHFLIPTIHLRPSRSGSLTASNLIILSWFFSLHQLQKNVQNFAIKSSSIYRPYRLTILMQ